MFRRQTVAPLLAVVILLICQSQARTVATTNQTLISPGSLWKYNASGTNLGTAWRAAAYVDSAWPQGPAQLGYGDGDEATTLGFGGDSSNRYITYYFRRSFNVASPADFASLTARVVRDDGVVVYLNGVEVARSNMPTGAVSYTTVASTAVGAPAESQWFDLPLDPSHLVPGTNVIAVELHQSGGTSTDISFDLELVGAEVQVPVPVVTLVAPANGAVSNSSAVTFTADVSAQAGLLNAALFIAGPPKTVAFSGSAQVEDAQITAETPATPNGNGLSINVDGATPHAHGLLRFPTLVGGGVGQVPSGAVINSATLQVNCTNPGATMNLYRLTQPWTESEATWTQRQTGVAWGAAGADGAASNAGVTLGGSCTAAGLRQINITRFVQEWSDGAPNHGIVLIDGGTDGVDFDSSESVNSPVLTVVYKDALVELASQLVSGAAATVNFPATVTQAGTWFWNVKVTDVTGAQSWAAADFEFTMDPAVPDEPVLVSPSTGATGVLPTAPLEATVSTPTGGSLQVKFELRRATEPEFTIIALPDTQHYSEAFPAIFTSQTQWIKDNKAARNIVFVTQEGDLVQNASVNAEWVRANTSMSIMDGVVPYGMAPGNHDEPSTLYNQFFPWTRYQGVYPWYGGHYQSLNDDNYQLFSAGGMDFVWVHLDFCPTAAAVAWGSSILNSFPNRIGAMTTHAYLDTSAQRTTHVCGSTQYLWDTLALPSPNLHFMLAGHVHGESRRTDVANGHPVFQMLADYQDRSSGGEGWLRILRFVPAEDKIYVQTYSPWLNQYEADADSEFTLDFPMGGAFETLGITSVSSGSTAVQFPQDLQPNTEYEWQVTVTNGAGKSRKGPIWHFTTGFAANTPPVATGNSYSVVSGTTLTTAAPGVLGNDTDAESSPLTAELVTNVTHGTLSLAANGSFVYTPAAAYVGPDSFTYRASDGQNWSNTATVSLTVTAAAPVTVFAANFNTNSDSFTYLDNTFRGTNQSSYASGARVSTGGFTGGALNVLVGGVDKKSVTNMSGGWRRTFTLAAPATVTLSFRYNMNQGADYESDDISQVLASMNGVLKSAGAFDWVAQLNGNGDGGSAVTTGWQLVTIELGSMPAGTHTLILGGFNNKKNSKSELTTVLIDDVTVVRR